MANGYNHRTAENQFSKWKKKDEQSMREAGMSENDIKRMFDYDREDFNSERRYKEHICGNSDKIINCMAIKVDNGYAETLEDFLNSIESFELAETLREVNFSTQLIVFLIYRGYDVAEVSKITGLSIWSIYRTIRKLKEIYYSKKK